MLYELTCNSCDLRACSCLILLIILSFTSSKIEYKLSNSSSNSESTLEEFSCLINKTMIILELSNIRKLKDMLIKGENILQYKLPQAKII